MPQPGRDALFLNSAHRQLAFGGCLMPLFPGNRLFQMIIDAAILSFALWLITVGLTYLVIYMLREFGAI